MKGDFSGGPMTAPGPITFTQTFKELTFKDLNSGEESKINGTLVASSEFKDPDFIWSSLNNLSIDIKGDYTEYRDWKKDMTFNTQTNILTVVMNGEFVATDANGRYTFTMINPMKYRTDQNNAQNMHGELIEGKFKVTAEDGSYVIATVIDPTSAQLEIDNDGDGTIDQTVVKPLDQLGFEVPKP